MLNSLVESGHVETHERGLHDVYALTDLGEKALLTHYEWLTECVENGP